MADRSAIEWTDASWNPLAAFDRETRKRGWFCTRVSQGCKNCYAAALNQRLGTGHDYQVRNLERIEFRLINLDRPLRWTRPRRIFVNSMTDLFHEAVPDEYIDRVFAVMALARQHIFQLLTKRPERMAKYMIHPDLPVRIGIEAFCLCLDGPAEGWGKGVRISADDGQEGRLEVWPLPNVWVGTSVEDQAAADERIPHLLRVPAAVRFLSCEPLLGPVDIREVAPQDDFFTDALDTPDPTRRVHWVIVGGESGPGARPCELAWIRSLVDQCRAAGVEAFVKQLGARPVDSEWEFGTFAPHDRRTPQPENGGTPPNLILLRDKKGGDPAEWPHDLRVREFPEPAHA